MKNLISLALIMLVTSAASAQTFTSISLEKSTLEMDPITGALALKNGFITKAYTRQSADSSPVPFELSASYFYDIRTKTSSAILLTHVGNLTFHHGKPFLGFYGFAGAQVSGGNSTLAGGALGKGFYVADQVSAFLGVGASIPAKGKLGAGFLAGLSYNFVSN